MIECDSALDSAVPWSTYMSHSSANRTTTKAADQHARTEMFTVSEYCSFCSENVLTASGDDEHWKSDAFIKKT